MEPYHVKQQLDNCAKESQDRLTMFTDDNSNLSGKSKKQRNHQFLS